LIILISLWANSLISLQASSGGAPPFAGGLDRCATLFSFGPDRHELLHAVLAAWRRAGLLRRRQIRR